MYKELYHRYKAAKQKQNSPGYVILEEIIQEKAPSFYIEVKTFREIIYKYHKENREKCQLS